MGDVVVLVDVCCLPACYIIIIINSVWEKENAERISWLDRCCGENGNLTLPGNVAIRATLRIEAGDTIFGTEGGWWWFGVVIQCQQQRHGNSEAWE